MQISESRYGHYTLHKKVNSKWITDLNEKHKTVKLLEDNLGENLDDLGFGNDFFRSLKAQTIKERIVKLDFIQIKNSAPLKIQSRE